MPTPSKEKSSPAEAKAEAKAEPKATRVAAPPAVPSPIAEALGAKFDPKAIYQVAGDRQAGRFNSITSTATGRPVYTKVGQLPDGRGIYVADSEGHPK